MHAFEGHKDQLKRLKQMVQEAIEHVEDQHAGETLQNLVFKAEPTGTDAEIEK